MLIFITPLLAMLKKIAPNFLLKNMGFIVKLLPTLLKIMIETKKYISCIRIQSTSMGKSICWIQHIKQTETKKKNKKKTKKWWQRRKSLLEINEQCCIWKMMENLWNTINVKLVSKKKDYLKSTSKPSYICHTKYLTMIWSRYVKSKLH